MPADTLVIRSQRIVDLCNPEDSKPLIVLDMGTVNHTDSFELFDITIKVTPPKIVFTSILTANTLSSTMTALGGPYLGSPEPGYFRVYGFTINRPVTGSLPIIALLGQWNGECSDSVFVEIAYEPEYNEEFAGREWSDKAVLIETTHNAKADLNTRIMVPRDSVIISPYDSVTTITFSIEFDKVLSTDAEIAFTIPKYKVIDSVTLNAEDFDITYTVSADETMIVARPRQLIKKDSVTLQIYTQKIKEEEVFHVTVQLRNRESECYCYFASQRDSLIVRKMQDTTSTNVDFDVGFDKHWISITQEFITVQNQHQSPMEIRMLDMTGRSHYNNVVPVGHIAVITIGGLSSGMYFVHSKCWKKFSTQMFLK